LRERTAYGLLLGATTLNLLVAGGRAGMVGFLVLVALATFQRLARRPVLAVTGALALALAIALVGYRSSDYFESRIDAAIDETLHYEQRTDSSVGTRIVLAANAWSMFVEHPWSGVGIGDYPREYERVRAERTPDWMAGYWNPHNQYLYALTSAGLPAGALLALALLYPLARRSGPDPRQRIRRALPLLMIVICFFESYLMRSNTSLMYALFTAACWSGAPVRARCNAS
jgi:O-antigen ligase